MSTQGDRPHPMRDQSEPRAGAAKKLTYVGGVIATVITVFYALASFEEPQLKLAALGACLGVAAVLLRGAHDRDRGMLTGAMIGWLFLAGLLTMVLVVLLADQAKRSSVAANEPPERPAATSATPPPSTESTSPSAGQATETTKAAGTKGLAEPEGPRSSFGDGTYEVGKEIAPGTYRSPGPTDSVCYWERLKGFDGEPESLLANELIDNGPARVTIKPSDKGFHSHGCGTWEKG